MVTKVTSEMLKSTNLQGWAAQDPAVVLASLGDGAAARQKTGRNMLINCGIPFNQLGFAGGALGAGVYGYDMWKGGAGGCNITINATTGVFTHTSGPLVQILESPDKAWGSQLTISVEDPSGTVNVSVGGATGSITAGAGRRGVTLSVPGGSGNMTVQLTATGVTYSRPQLERGSVATEFEQVSTIDNIARCCWFYESSYEPGVAPGTVARIGAHVTGAINGFFLYTGAIRFGYPKRAVPTMTVYAPRSGTAGQMSEVGTAGAVIGDRVATPTQIGRRGFQVVSTNTGLTAGNIVELQWVADCRL